MRSAKQMEHYVDISEATKQESDGQTRYSVTIGKRFIGVRSNHGGPEDTRADAVLKHMTKSSDVTSVRYYQGMYVPVGKDQISVAPGITARIQDLKEERERDELQTLSIVLESSTVPVRSIRDFVEECNEAYHQDLQNKLADKLFVFENVPWQGVGNPRGSGPMQPTHGNQPPYLLFNKSPFVTNRTLSNVFFEERDLLEKRLTFFQNSQEWYDTKGYPYMLGLLFHGQPGCGEWFSLVQLCSGLCINARLVLQVKQAHSKL